MLSKNHIVRKNWEFQRIISGKRQHLNRFLILYYLKSRKFEIGISSPKKFANAVQRNRLKRQIRVIVSQQLNPQTLPYRVVLIVRKDFIPLPFAQKQQHIARIFAKLN